MSAIDLVDVALEIHSPSALDGLARATRLAHECVNEAAAGLEAGESFSRVDEVIARLIEQQGGKPAYSGYQGFPNRSTIPSIDDTLCNGLVTSRRLSGGELLSFSVAVELEGWFAKCEDAFLVGASAASHEPLVRAAYEMLEAGISVMRPGARLGDLGAAMQAVGEGAGYGVVTDFCGHGIGRSLHEAPQVSCVGRRGSGIRLREGMCLYVMAMLTEGAPETAIASDGWTARTKDGRAAVGIGRMVTIGKQGPELLVDRLEVDRPIAGAALRVARPRSLQAGGAVPWRPKLAPPTESSAEFGEVSSSAATPRWRRWLAALRGK